MAPLPASGRSTGDPTHLHRDTLTALVALLLRLGLRLRDLVLVALWSPRLLGLDLCLLWASLRRSPYRGPSFDDLLTPGRSRARAGDLTYGEVPWTTLGALLRWARLQPGELFVDLGCGAGRTLALAAQGFGARALGVERVQHRARLATRLLRSTRWPEVSVRHADAIDVELGTCDVALLNWTCFGETARAQLGRALQQMRPGSRVIALTYPVDGPGWVVTASRQVWLSWGRGSAYLQQRC